jgi:TPR repeat protein
VNEALRYYRRAHKARYESASSNLATMLAEGRAGAKDVPQAVRTYLQTRCCT